MYIYIYKCIYIYTYIYKCIYIYVYTVYISIVKNHDMILSFQATRDAKPWDRDSRLVIKGLCI